MTLISFKIGIDNSEKDTRIKDVRAQGEWDKRQGVIRDEAPL